MRGVKWGVTVSVAEPNTCIWFPYGTMRPCDGSATEPCFCFLVVLDPVSARLIAALPSSKIEAACDTLIQRN